MMGEGGGRKGRESEWGHPGCYDTGVITDSAER